MAIVTDLLSVLASLKTKYDTAITDALTALPNDGILTDIISDIKAVRNSISVPTVCITFDHWPETYSNAMPIMTDHGLTGTFYVDPTLIDNPAVISTTQLNTMRTNGWSIQPYSGVNMVNLYNTSGAQAAKDKLILIKSQMKAKGFIASSLAPNQRSWNAALRDLSVGIFSTVRVIDQTFTYQEQPVADPLYIRKGATNSLGGSDTVASLNTQVDDIIANKGLWTLVVHKVSDDGDVNYSISKSIFTSFMMRLRDEQQRGNLRVVHFDKILPVKYFD